MAGKKLYKDDKEKDKNRVAKPAGHRFVGKSKARPTKAEIAKGKKTGKVYYESRPERSDVSKKNKLETGGAIEPCSCRLVTYDVWGNTQDGFWVNQVFPTETVVDFPKGTDDEKLIGILKEKGILTEKANNEKIAIDGEEDLVLFFTDSEKGMPLFELRNIENYDKKSDGGNLNGSEVLNPTYFKTTSPVSSTESNSQQTVEQVNVNDTQGQNTSTNNEEVKADSEVKKDDAPLLDYDTSQEGVLKQHMNGNEVYVGHLQQILQRPLRYEEIVGSIRLRKCFLRPYYKVI